MKKLGSDKLSILIDCDGVLANSVEYALTWIRRETGHALKESHVKNVTNMNIFRSIGFEVLENKFWNMMANEPGHVMAIQPYPGSREAMDALRMLGHRVRCVTRATHGRAWYYERVEWLNLRMGFATDDVIFAAEKSDVQGDILLDDNPEVIRSWKGGRWALLWDRPWNQEHKKSATPLPHLESWDIFLSLVQGGVQGI